MPGYKKISEPDLAWREARERFLLEGRQLMRRVMDQVLDEVDTEFQTALLNGRVLEFKPDNDELKRRLLRTAKKELGTK
jgi:hypothetical protein